LCHFRCLAYQAVEASGFFIDDSEQVLALGVVKVVIGEQAGDRGLGTGERRAQFVRHGIQQHGAQVFAL